MKPLSLQGYKHSKQSTTFSALQGACNFHQSSQIKLNEPSYSYIGFFFTHTLSFNLTLRLNISYKSTNKKNRKKVTDCILRKSEKNAVVLG